MPTRSHRSYARSEARSDQLPHDGEHEDEHLSVGDGRHPGPAADDSAESTDKGGQVHALFLGVQLVVEAAIVKVEDDVVGGEFGSRKERRSC
jgi:hypothetical protein